MVLRARLDLGSGLRVGDVVDVELAPAQVLLFDPDTQKRFALPGTDAVNAVSESAVG